MVYIEKLYLPSEESENGFLANQRLTCYSTYYPFTIFPGKGLATLIFEPITILYGGNGSGKTTLLNVIAEKSDLIRHSAFSGSAFFKDYLEMCRLSYDKIPRHSQILTSDDVTDYLLNMRHLNNGINLKRDELFEEYNKNTEEKSSVLMICFIQKNMPKMLTNNAQINSHTLSASEIFASKRNDVFSSSGVKRKVSRSMSASPSLVKQKVISCRYFIMLFGLIAPHSFE